MSANRVEKLVYWYLRFNGYFTVENFTIHPDRKKEREAELDVVAVRFPFSEEDPENHCLYRDSSFIIEDRTDFLMVEIASGKCKLNVPWIDERAITNLAYVLRWMGFTNDNDYLDTISKEINQSGYWIDDNSREGKIVRFVIFGLYPDDDLASRYPAIPQIHLSTVVEFLRNRVMTHCARLQRDKWDEYIQEFADRSDKKANSEELLNWTLGNL